MRWLNIDHVVKAYENERCDALSTDVSQLVSYRSKMVNEGEAGRLNLIPSLSRTDYDEERQGEPERRQFA